MASEAQAPARQGSYIDRYWTASDGLELHCRDYAGPDGGSDKAPVLCIPGLARNARDFEHLAPMITQTRRLILVNLRGCGGSDNARDISSYRVPQYVEDVMALIKEEGIDRVVLIGTSLGGVVSMILADAAPERVTGVLLNDVGPRSERAGLERICDAVGQGKSYPTWVHAARELSSTHRDAFPDYGLDHWIGFAKKIYRLISNGNIKADYDLGTVEAFRQANAKGGSSKRLWAALDTMADMQVTVLRGELSDVLSETTVREMRDHLPGGQFVTVPRVGHPPALDEPVAIAAIEDLLARCD